MAMASCRNINTDSEDSGYTKVKVGGSQMQGSKSKGSDVKNVKNNEIVNLKQIKVLNKNLTEQIQALKKTLIDKDKKFEDEKKQMSRSHKRENEKYKKENREMQSQVAAKGSEMQMKEALHKEEIQQLKAQIQSLELSEIELRDKIKTLEATKYKHEYEQQKREMSASKAELEKLKKQIASLEKAAEERDAQIAKTEEDKSVMTVGFDRTIGEMSKKHEKLEADMASMKNDLLNKMEENDKVTKEMLHNIQGLLLAGKERQTSVEPSPGKQRTTPLPPIYEPRSKSRSDSQSSHWKP